MVYTEQMQLKSNLPLDNRCCSTSAAH